MDQSWQLDTVTIYCSGIETTAVWYKDRWWCRLCGKEMRAVSLDNLTTRSDRLVNANTTSAPSS